MAESCNVAFGHFLRMLRGRRGLSLDEVAALSRTFADSVAKSYLSRVENGHISLALPKLIPLSRIYEIPPEVVLERLELDMELDKVGGPETSGLDFTQMSERGKAAIDRGAIWDAYAYFRDSAQVARSSPLMGRLRDHSEQLLCAHMNLSTAAIKLGRCRLTLFELEFIHSTGRLSARLQPLLFERLSAAHFSLNEMPKAREYADLAIAEAEESQERDFLGYFLSSRARIAMQEGEVDRAIELYQRAFEEFRLAEVQPECALMLYNLAQAYVFAKRYTAARRALLSADRLAGPLGQNRIRALVRILLGEVEELNSKPVAAAQHWREAASIAKDMNDRIIKFRAEYFLYKQARSQGHALEAKAIEKRLNRVAPWIPREVAELGEFHQLVALAALAAKRKKVAQLQPTLSNANNPN